MHPLVSVLMPVYNAAPYLAESIESILNQSYDNFEFIIVDDGSTDNSKQVIKSYAAKDARIKLFERSNAGVVDALNFGLSHCRGQYIARMDADDISMKERLSFQVQFLNQNPDVGIVGSWVKLFGARNEVWHHRQHDAHIKALMLFKTCGFSHSSVLIKKEIYSEFSYSNSAKHVEDMELFLRIRLNSSWKFANLPKILINYRVHTDQVSTKFKSIQEDNFFFLTSKYIRHFIPNATANELRTHWDICNQVAAISEEDLIQKGQWLKKLSQALSASDKDPFFVIDEKWLDYCLLNGDIKNLPRIYSNTFAPKKVCFLRQKEL